MINSAIWLFLFRDQKSWSLISTVALHLHIKGQFIFVTSLLLLLGSYTIHFNFMCAKKTCSAIVKSIQLFFKWFTLPYQNYCIAESKMVAKLKSCGGKAKTKIISDSSSYHNLYQTPHSNIVSAGKFRTIC